MAMCSIFQCNGNGCIAMENDHTYGRCSHRQNEFNQEYQFELRSHFEEVDKACDQAQNLLCSHHETLKENCRAMDGSTAPKHPNPCLLYILVLSCWRCRGVLDSVATPD